MNTMLELVEDALLSALEEAGPKLPKDFSIRIPDKAYAALAHAAPAPHMIAGGYTIRIYPDSALTLFEDMTLAEWIEHTTATALNDAPEDDFRRRAAAALRKVRTGK